MVKYFQQIKYGTGKTARGKHGLSKHPCFASLSIDREAPLSK